MKKFLVWKNTALLWMRNRMIRRNNSPAIEFRRFEMEDFAYNE